MRYLIIISILIIGCVDPIIDDTQIGDNDTINNTDTSIVEIEDQLYPLAINNYWVFDKQYISIDTTYHQEIRTEVLGKDTLSDDIWFRVDTYIDSIYTMNENYLIENDSVYVLQPSFETPIRALKYFIPEDSVQTFLTTIGGDMIISVMVNTLDSNFVTPLGNCNNCYSYTSTGPEWTNVTILKYGIGIVMISNKFYSYTSEDTTRVVYTITEYDVGNEP